MTNRPVRAVRGILQAYADRGVFRGFSEVAEGRFKFVWLINQQMEFSVDTSRRLLKFKHLLESVPQGSPMYADLKRFIQDRHDRALPAHRRVDLKRAEASCTNRRGVVTLSLEVKNNQYAYGARRLVNLVHELFLHLRQAYPEYLMENFDVPQE